MHSGGNPKVDVALRLGQGREDILVPHRETQPQPGQAVRLREAVPGLSELLQGQCKTQQVIRKPEGFEFDVLTSGAIPENPSELLGSTTFDQVLLELAFDYDLVMVDAPVLLAVSDALLLAHRVDGALLVHAPGTVDKKDFARIREALNRAGANVIGLVVNKVSIADPYQYPSYLRSPYLADPRHSKHSRFWRGRKARKSAGS